MKKLISAALAAVLTLVCAAVLPAEGMTEQQTEIHETGVDYTGEKIAVKAKKGDTVEIVTSLSGVKKTNGIWLSFDYDSSLLEYNEYKSSTGHTVVNTDITNRIMWSTMFSANGTDFDSKTDIAVLYFTALSDIAYDSECVSFVIKEFYDTQFVDLPVSAVTVESRVNGIVPTADIYGDANGDGKVTNADALVILRHTIKASSLPSDRIDICDVNRDGKLTAADALQITRWCIGYKSDYPIGKSNN